MVAVDRVATTRKVLRYDDGDWQDHCSGKAIVTDHVTKLLEPVTKLPWQAEHAVVVAKLLAFKPQANLRVQHAADKLRAAWV